MVKATSENLEDSFDRNEEVLDYFDLNKASIIECKHTKCRVWHDRSAEGNNRCYTVCNDCGKILNELPKTDWFD